MSKIHIVSSGGRARCGRDQIRGFLDLFEYAKLNAEGRIGTRVKMSVKHNCEKRPCDCLRRRETVSAMCQECV